MFGFDLTKLGIIGAIVLAIVAFIARILNRAKQAGIDKERADGLAQQATKVSDANQARAGLAGATDAQLDDSLRPPGSRGGH